ncbi:OprD family porin [Pseudomonas typographi]|uniref:OprD family porin n=1 Tax=Pseudomonas typographi TaxID=2715964 RepID=A0ABR7Z258_9PSED|nr:OprD family porin [Pseudomonas typographi]MBD1589830.1 OprD family porin [Pseudomonas typographi]MBD1599489.1 OprD family porin [Pseudomonas typographi]
MKSTSAITLIAGTLCMNASAWADFVDDGKAVLDLKNFYFNNDMRDATGKTAEWGQGAVFNYRSGFTEGVVGFGVDAQTMLGLRLDGGKGDHKGSSMIPDDSDGGARHDWSHGGAAAKMKVSNTVLTYGNTLQPNLPILKSNDGRLLPQTYEGGIITSKEISDVTLVAGQLEHMVGRGSTNRSGFAVGGPSGKILPQSNQFRFAGADWKATPNLLLQYYYANMEDYYGQHFLGLTHVAPLGADTSLTSDVRYFRSSADGANGTAAGRAEGYRVGGYTHDGSGEIDNRTWSAAFTLKHGGHSLMVGHQRVSEGSNFVQPNQANTGEGAGGYSNYLLTDRLIFNFTRAGERTSFAQYDYNFKQFGLPGLTAGISYLSGDHIKNTSDESQEEWERDLAIDYQVQQGALKGVKLGWRNGALRGNATNDQDQNRLIVSYSIPLF